MVIYVYLFNLLGIYNYSDSWIWGYYSTKLMLNYCGYLCVNIWNSNFWIYDQYHRYGDVINKVIISHNLENKNKYYNNNLELQAK
jgi:hypothetical protein